MAGDVRGMMSRRELLRAAAAGLAGVDAVRISGARAAVHAGTAAYDVVIVGGGAAGFSAALGVKREDPRASVVVLEARPIYGGTTYRSGGRLWIPNNADLRQAGLSDPKHMALRYMARLSYPDDYDPEKPRIGLTRRHHRQLSAFYDQGAEMLDHYRATKIMPWHAETGVFLPGTSDPLGITGKLAPDYHPEFEEDVPKVGRAIMPELIDPTGVTASELGRATSAGNFGASLYGPDVIEWLHLAAVKRGVEVHTAMRAIDLLVARTAGGGAAVRGVRAAVTLHGGTVVSDPIPDVTLPVHRTYRARRGVIFTAGGFSKSPKKMAKAFHGDRALTGGGCGVVTAVGDFTDMARRHGFMLEHLDKAWFIENVYEQWRLDSNSAATPNYLLFQAFWLTGDSMLVVNRRGVRVFNEKSDYDSRTKLHFHADNRFLFSVFDQHALVNTIGVGGQITPAVNTLIGPANDIPTLRRMLADRLNRYPETKAFGLADDFERTLTDTVQRFNGFAREGVDRDFHRGETFLDIWWHALICGQFHPVDLPGTPLRDCINANRDEHGNRYPNPTMRPLAPPYYAVILSSGLQDTKGGPAIDEHARVLDRRGRPVAGLYGAGNCIASPAAAGYWGAGGTLGPATVFGHIAGRHAARRTPAR